jgi:hypothetical protein
MSPKFNLKKGTPLKLGDDLDLKVQAYIKVIRSNGCVINSSNTKSIRKGIVLATDKTLFIENSGEKKKHYKTLSATTP